MLPCICLCFLVGFERFGGEARGEGGTEAWRSTFAGVLSFFLSFVGRFGGEVSQGPGNTLQPARTMSGALILLSSAPLPLGLTPWI